MNNKINNYFQGVAWFMLSLVVSAINDVLTKYLGSSLHSYEVTFFRFFFAAIVLIPFIVCKGFDTLKTSRPYVHFMRGLLLFFAIAGWTYGLSVSPVTTATIVSFTVPIFVLILGIFFLNENIIWQRWLVTVTVFCGLVVTMNPSSEDFNPVSLVFVMSAIFFAILDVINKRFVVKESMISMLFYSAIITSLLALPFAIYFWTSPSIYQLFLLFLLGSGANLILFFILKAFHVVDATALAPYRYLELVFSAIIAFIVFSELPNYSSIIGAIIIVPSTLFIIYSEKSAAKD